MVSTTNTPSGWFYSWKTLPANDHYGSRENHVCGWKRFHTQLITFLVSQTSISNTKLNPPCIHIWASYKLSVLSVLSDDQKSKFNFSSTFNLHSILRCSIAHWGKEQFFVHKFK